MRTSESHSFNDFTKEELIEQLQAAHAKNETMIRFVDGIIHETRAPTAMVLGYANLILKKGETTTSRSDIIKYVQGIKKAAERIQEAQNSNIVWWRMLQLFAEPFAQTTASLAGIKNFEELVGAPIKTDLSKIPPILAKEDVLFAVIKSLGYAKSEEAEIHIKQDGDYIYIILSGWIFSSYWVEQFLDIESGRLVCSSQSKIFEPIGIVIALIEKYSGAVYAELGSNSTYSLTFALPIFKEAT